MHQERLAVRTGDRYARHVRSPPAVRGIDHGVGHDGEQSALELVAQGCHAGRERRLLAGRELHRCPEPHDPRHVLGARADAELLAAAVDDCLDDVTIPQHQCPDALGRADLVAGDGEEGACDVGQRDGDLAEGLHPVDVERDAGLATSRREPGDRLDHADLVVHPHHAHHCHAERERLAQSVLHNLALTVHRQDDFLAPEPSHRVSRRQDCLVLDRRHRDPERAPTLACGQRAPDHRQVVGLSAAGREDHLARIRAERRGDLALRLLHAGPRRAPEAVRRGWVPEGVRPQIGQHGLEHLRAYRRGGRVVEVDQALGHAGKSRS